MTDIRLVATDLDGTLIGSANDFPFYKDFRERMAQLRQTDGTVWVACTGRNRSSFRDFFSPMRNMGIMPDYIILNHAYVHSLTRFGYRPHIFWNIYIRYQLLINRILVHDAMNEWNDLFTGGALGVTTLRQHRDRLCMRFDSEEAAGVAADMLKERIYPYKNLRVFRHFLEVEVRAIPFTKGLAVAELTRHLGITRQQVLAIGNGHNDISMLDGTVAALTGCPANSEAEVMETVHLSGGHIAEGRSLRGVMEILEAVTTGKVNCELPEWWADSIETMRQQSHHSKKSKLRRKKMIGLWLAGGVAYTVMLVFANFGLIPLVSGLIMKPYWLLVSLVERVMLLFN